MIMETVIRNIHTKYPPVSDKNKRIAYQQLPDKIREGISFEQWKDIYKGNNPSAIIKAFSKATKSKKKREDSIDDSYYTKEKNYKGRKPSKDWDIVREAFKILFGETWEEWERELNITPSQYFDLRERLVHARYDERYHDVIKDYPKKAIDKMLDELSVLWLVYGLCLKELDRAKERKDTLFIKTLREVFDLYGEDPSEFIDSKTGKGDKVSRETIIKRLKEFRGYCLMKKKTIELSKTFYERVKPAGICELLCRINRIFTEPLKRLDAELERLKAIKKIKLLMEKYFIAPHELFPEYAGFKYLPKVSLSGAGLGAGLSTVQDTIVTDTMTLIEQILKRQTEIENELKNI